MSKSVKVVSFIEISNLPISLCTRTQPKLLILALQKKISSIVKSKSIMLGVPFICHHRLLRKIFTHWKMIFCRLGWWLMSCYTDRLLGNAKQKNSSSIKWLESQSGSESPLKSPSLWKISLKSVWKLMKKEECLWMIWKCGFNKPK